MAKPSGNEPSQAIVQSNNKLHSDIYVKKIEDNVNNEVYAIFSIFNILT